MEKQKVDLSATIGAHVATQGAETIIASTKIKDPVKANQTLHKGMDLVSIAVKGLGLDTTQENK
jgi:hypothetical protein